MNLANLPTWIAKYFAQDAAGSYVRNVPLTTGDANAASFTLGFPPNTFVDEGAGGKPPDGRDFNGVLRYLSAWAQWQGAGGPIPYNAAISSNGGYPLGAVVQSATTAGLFWQATIDGNTTNPDAAGAGWVSIVLRRATLAQLQAATSDLVVPTAKGLKDAGYDRIIGQSLADNNGWRAFESGFKEAWGYGTLSAGASVTVSFASVFAPGYEFISFHRVTLGSAINPSGGASVQIGLTATDVTGFTLRNGGGTSASYQWSTRGV